MPADLLWNTRKRADPSLTGRADLKHEPAFHGCTVTRHDDNDYILTKTEMKSNKDGMASK